MQSFFLDYRSSRIHYLVGGHGQKPLLCFHGYGETAGSFSFLESALADQYTLVALDFPFHGQTEWKEGLLFTPEDLLAILGMLGDKHPGIFPPKTPAAKTFLYLLGYSLGGRVALALLEKMLPESAKVILLAPDGMRVNPWYWLATQSRIGNLLFRFTMKYPGWLFTILRFGQRFGLVNPAVYKFTAAYIDNKSVRSALYCRWTTMRSFRPGLASVRSGILSYRITLRLLYGQYDRIIRSKRGAGFLRALSRQAGKELPPPDATLSILPAGHRLLQEKYLDELLQAIRD